MNVSKENSITLKTIDKIFQESAWNIEPTITILGVTYTASEFNKAVEMLKNRNSTRISRLSWIF